MSLFGSHGKYVIARKRCQVYSGLRYARVTSAANAPQVPVMISSVLRATRPHSRVANEMTNTITASNRCMDCLSPLEIHGVGQKTQGGKPPDAEAPADQIGVVGVQKATQGHAQAQPCADPPEDSGAEHSDHYFSGMRNEPRNPASPTPIIQ